MHLFLIIFSIFGIIYFFQISKYIYGFRKLKSYRIIIDNIIFENKKRLSVIIPFKNEEKNLETLIHNLSNQTLKNNLYEIILVNDNSTDNSVKVLEQLLSNKDNFKLIHSDSKPEGKKTALSFGITRAKGDLIVTTDADCTHNKKWLETILNYYNKHKPKMLIAPVLMQGKSFFGNMQSLEFLSLIASTAGSTGIGHPIMCNGANLSYEKKVYEEFKDALNMKEKSGDDIFLLHNIKKKYPKEIHFLKSNDAVVYTKAEKSLKSFFRQRVRWASKSSSYKDSDSIISSIIVLLSNLLLIVLYVLSIFDISFLTTALVLTMLKIIPDLILILLSAGYFKIKKLIAYFPVTMTVYPFYIVITAVAGLFTKKISWK
ncbi:MAG: glycosyltransferase [Bacteroidales bacterium]|nr:glycosyltransferase [Bacteroidales bacterium]